MGKTDRLLKNAKSHLSENEYGKALRLFNQVLNREPAHPEALKFKGYIKVQTGDQGEAEDFLRSAAEKCRDDEIYVMLGSLHLNNSRADKAVSWLLRALEINGKNGAAHYSLGIVYARHREDHEKAVRHLSKAIELDTAAGEAYYNRGCSYMILHRMQKAENDFRKALEMNNEKAQEMLDTHFS